MKSGRFSLSGRIRNRANAHRCPRGPKESVKHGLLPPGIPFGFNHDDRELGWVLAAEDVDLRAYVAFALRPGIGGVFHATAGGWGIRDPRSRDANDPRRCEVCYWIRDPVQTGHWTYRGGANGIKLVEAIWNLPGFDACDARFRDRVRAPRTEEFPP
jgi:hypothetical protein